MCWARTGMHEDRPGHVTTFAGMEDFVANKLGSLFTSDEPNSWIGISLKKKRMAVPTHYTLVSLENYYYYYRRTAVRVLYACMSVGLVGAN